MNRVPELPAADERGCRSCEGRGWRLASRHGSVRLAEEVVRLVRRKCPDCGEKAIDQMESNALASGLVDAAEYAVRDAA